MTLLLMGVTAVYGGDVAVSFARGGWKEADWTMVKCGRWPNIGAWVQRDDHIENRIPADATKDEMLGQRAPETYTSMVWKTPVTTSFTHGLEDACGDEFHRPFDDVVRLLDGAADRSGQ